jgi:hypothetical protein
MRVLVFARRCTVWLQQAHISFDGEFHLNQSEKCMRPTKLLAISTIAGLSLLSYGKSAHARPVSADLVGSVTSSCTLTTEDGEFTENSEPAIELVANSGDRGTVVVICNDASKRLTLAINTGASVLHNGTAKMRSKGVLASGVFGITNVPTAISADPIVRALNKPTAAGGDTLRLQARVDPPTGMLLKAGHYNLVVDATITP